MAANDEPIDDDRLLELIAIHHHPSGKPNAEKIAVALGRSRSGVNRALNRLARNGLLGTKAVLPGFAIKQVSEQQDADGEVQKTWIKQAPLGETFEVPEGHSVKGVSALVDAQGNTVQQWIKTKADPAEDIKSAALDAFKEYEGRSPLIPPPDICDGRLLTVYPIADFHFGMLAWGQEVGAAWDLKIAKKTILDAVDQLIASAPKSKTAIILNLGDFLHADDATNATPASGHQLDVDGRFRKIAAGAIAIHVALIEKALEKHDEVIVEYLPGNHDPNISHVIVIALELFFLNNPRVKVDSDPSEFFWHRHGKVLIGANHGHKIKPSELPGVMAAYRPEDWGKTKFRYCYGGHIHHRSSGGGGEKHGAVWETFQTVAGKDAYSHSHGYSSGRSLVSITHHDERGEIMRQTVSV